jgi:alpha-ketoglutarate-dependent taurine dioxygenase
MSAQPAAATVNATPDTLTVEWADGTRAEFASVWLRDNIPEHRDPHSGQRLVDVADLPERPRIRRATARDGWVLIGWDDESKDATFRLDWLATQARSGAEQHPETVPRLWLEGSTLDARRDFASASWAEARDDPTRRCAWLSSLVQHGVAFLRVVPTVESALLEAMQMVGQVAETNYGLVFDVRAVPQPENLAYSDLGLGLHTDNPYREPVPGFQALHALIASPDGGDSVFADGFALAEHLRKSEPEAFELLTRTPVPFHYRSQNADLYAERPLIQLSCGGDVSAVHYNSRSIAPLLDPSAARTAPFYAAYRRLAQLLRETRLQLKFRLLAGEIVVFDNQRILHGRTPFSSARHARHLRGCYLTRDSVYSNAALLCRARQGAG